MGDGFQKSKDPTNSIKVLNEKCYKGKPRKSKQQNTHIYIQKYTIKRYTHNTHDTSRPLVYTNTGVTSLGIDIIICIVCS